MTAVSTIFISHSSSDSAVAAEVRRRLMAEGHSSVFLDFDPADGIPAGRSWEQELYARLRACRAVVVLCSEPSMASDWVFAEITHARALGKHVFPLRVAACRVRSLLADVQVIDLTADPEAGFERLWSGLRLAGLDPKSQFDWDGSRPPYPGLLAFQEEDAAIFFGRELEIAEGLGLLQRLRRFGGTGWLLALGASGSGKSSLVRAGLLPRLRNDRDSWLVVGPFRPLDRPFDELARAFEQAFSEVGAEPAEGSAVSSFGHTRAGALVDLAEDLRRAAGRPEAGVLLVLDQVEELLGRAEGGEADRFLTLLRSALEIRGAPLAVLGTLRSDYLGDFQGHPALRELPFASLSVGPLSVEGFARVIEGPAELAGIELETGLVQAMVADTETEDALPLLAFTLRELWQGYGESGRMTLADYHDRLGGLGGSVARAATTALGPRELRPAEEAELRDAFLAMARIDEDGQYVRQSARADRLPAGSHEVLERFVDARLLVARGDGEERLLEVAHEALLRVWDRLVGWLDEDRAFLLWRKRIGESLRQWQGAGRRGGYLLRGPALGEAAGWLQRRRDLLRAGEREFIRASARAGRLRRYGVVAFLAAVALALAFLALRAEQQRRRTEQMRIGANDIGRLIAARQLRQVARMAPFGRALLEPSARGLVALDRPELLYRSLDLDQMLGSVVGRSPDQLLMALRTPAGVEIRASLDGRWRVALEHADAVQSIAVEDAPNQTLTESVARGRYVLSAADDGVARLWSLPSLRPLIRAILEQPDRARLEELLGQGTGGPRLSAELLVEFAGHDGRVSYLAFGPGGRYAATAAGDELAVWRTDSGAQPVVLRGHDGDVTWAAFSPDGRLMISTSADRRALIWSLEDPFAAPRTLAGHAAGLIAAAFSADSRRVLTAAVDREIRQWQVAGGDSAAIAAIDCDPIELKYAWTPGLAAVACADGTARILEIATGQTQIFQ